MPTSPRYPGISLPSILRISLGQVFFRISVLSTADGFNAYMQPSLTPAPTVDDINTSQREVYDALSGSRTGAQLRVQDNWVHVAVVAEAHVRATHAAAAGGERIILRSGPYFIQDFRKLYISIISDIRGSDVMHGISGRGCGAWHPECATWGTRFDKGYPIPTDLPVDESGRAFGADAGDAFERRSCRICRGLQSAWISGIYCIGLP